VDFSWDGKLEDGTQLTDGRYTISAEVHRGNEVNSGVTLTSAQVESVTLGKGGQDLTLTVSNLGDISMADIRKIM
ncbi:MAG: hypothetical protein ISR69_05190, partial [Gammaproteobacteria bacterium]|nr:hypothetical protein [Gammaproteobacteria bacterium]